MEANVAVLRNGRGHVCKPDRTEGQRQVNARPRGGERQTNRRPDTQGIEWPATLRGTDHNAWLGDAGRTKWTVHDDAQGIGRVREMMKQPAQRDRAAASRRSSQNAASDR